jgi:hypothetical protein
MGRATLAISIHVIEELLHIPLNYSLVSAFVEAEYSREVTFVVESPEIPESPAGTPLKKGQLILTQAIGRIEVD